MQSVRVVLRRIRHLLSSVQMTKRHAQDHTQTIWLYRHKSLTPGLRRQLQISRSESPAEQRRRDAAPRWDFDEIEQDRH